MLEFIVNPKARRGTGVEEVKAALAELDRRNIAYTVTYTEYRKHATEIARQLTLSGADTIVSCGGDGTIHEIINGIISARFQLEKEGKTFVTKLALLPCGTGNDFMRSVGLPTDTLAALNVIISGKPSLIDAINVDGVYEICFACRGIDVDVVNMVNGAKKKTPSSYLKMLLKCVFNRVNYDFVLNIDGQEIKENGVIAAVLNGGKIASGMNICPKCAPDDGFLNVVLVKNAPVFNLLFTLGKIAGNNFLSNKNVLHYTAKKVNILTEQAQIDVDGELYENKKFDAEIAPNILYLIR